MLKTFLLLLMLTCIGFLPGCSGQSIGPLTVDKSGQSSVNTTEGELRDAEMLALALSYKSMYEGMNKGTAYNVVISEEGIAQIVKHLAAQGCTVTAYMRDMENHRPFESFLHKALEGQTAFAWYYRVDASGGFTRYDYTSDDTRLYLTIRTLVWDDDMNPHIQLSDNITVIEEWTYTDKGFLLYRANQSPLCHTLLRVAPLGETNRELCRKYIAPVGYAGNNLFLVDWEPFEKKEIVFNDIYDTLLYLETGGWPEYDLDAERVGAEDLEPLCEKYLGVSTAFLRKNALYYEDENAYFWNYLSCGKHVIWFPDPVPEVVDSWENEDGTLTMVVDALDIYQGDDRVFTHEVTIRTHEDGSFEYVSNRIWPDGKDNIPTYVPRSVQPDLFSPHDAP